MIMDIIQCGWCEDKFLPNKDTFHAYEIGRICVDCENGMEDKTGYCSSMCQLSGECDESC